MQRFEQAFYPKAVDGLMCKTLHYIGWDGAIYECDFNQMLGTTTKPIRHIADFYMQKLAKRTIQIHEHCYGCTVSRGNNRGG